MPSITKDMNNQPLWVSKDGRRFIIKEMALSHLKNAIAKIKRENWRKHYLPTLEAELALRQMKDSQGKLLLTARQARALRLEEEKERYQLREV